MEDLHGFAAGGETDPLQDAFVLGNPEEYNYELRHQGHSELSLPGGDHPVALGTPHLHRFAARGRSLGTLPLSEDPLLIDGI